MTGLCRMSLRLAWLILLALGGGLDTYAQTVAPEPWWDDLLVREEFTGAYRRARDRTAAEDRLRQDPISVETVALLARAGREDDAIDLVERIGRSRPDLLKPAFEQLVQLSPPYPVWNPGSQAMAARLKALEDDIAQRAVASPPGPERYDKRLPEGPKLYGEGERALLNARDELERARKALAEQRKWSVREVATAMAPSFRQMRSVAERYRGEYGREALALLADGEFEAGQLREAASDFTLLEQRYQGSEVAWTAAMRAAQLTQSVGDPDRAARRFARIAAMYSGKATVTALATFYEARAYEATARWRDALTAYHATFNAWPVEDENWIGLNWKVLYFSHPFAQSLWPRDIRRADVARRIEALTRAVADPSAGEVERAAWLLDHERPSEARDILLRAATLPQDTAAAVISRSLLHRAGVAKAVSAISHTGQIPRAARRALERVCGEPFDSWVGVSCAIYASVLAVDGKAEAAETQLLGTLRAWVQAQGGGWKLTGTAGAWVY
jgi:hypothetical protein